MIDLILLVFVVAVFCAGFLAGSKFGTAAKAWAYVSTWWSKPPK